jgi:hypothetical protein
MRLRFSPSPCSRGGGGARFDGEQSAERALAGFAVRH